MTCSVEGCEQKRRSRGMCNAHYLRWRKGQTDAGRDLTTERLTGWQPRFWSKVVVGPTCWQWVGTENGAGYGVFGIGAGSPKRAHRIAFELVRGPIPDGLVIDHLCRNRGCVNPWHLEPVTIGENSRRGRGPTFIAHRAGTCRRGHPVTPENAYHRPDRPGVLVCRVCQKERDKSRVRRR